MRLVPSKIQSQAIFLSFVPLAFLLVFLALVAVLVDRTSELTIWTQHAETVLDKSDAILKTLGDANNAVVAYSQSKKSSDLARYRLLAQRLRNQSADLVALVTVPEQKRRAQQYQQYTGQLLGVLQEYLAAIRAGNPAKAQALAAAPSTRASAANFQKTKSTFDNVERQLTSARFKTLRGELQFYGLILLVVTLAGIILTLFTTSRFGIRIAARLQQLAQNADALGEGKPTLPVSGDDEIADLDRSYHHMADRLHDMASAYRREHYIASTLQRALLPQDLPRVPGLRVDTAYTAAAQAADIGGDWYDVFTLDRQNVAISVGDVGGHGLRAAAIMGSLRQAVRMAARVNSEPASVLDRTNRALCADETDAIATAFFATLDLENGKLRYAVAGHPLPLNIYADGEIRQLQGEGLILGVDPTAAFQTFETDLREGEAIVGFTDGIVELERDYFKGMSDLVAAVRAEYARASSDNIAERIRDRILAHAQPLDDSAILFVGVTSLGSELRKTEKRWTIDAKERGAAYRIRRAVLWELAREASPHSDLSAAEVILGELLSNVARHTPGPAEVTLDLDDGSARLRVCDTGQPFHLAGHTPLQPLALSGRGLYLVRSLAREVDLQTTEQGNCVNVVLPVHLSAA